MNDAPEDSLFVLLLLLLLLLCAQPRLERRGWEVDGVAHLSSGAAVMRYTPVRAGVQIFMWIVGKIHFIQVLYENLSLRFERIYMNILAK